jgi:mono/diheme cytochrome c family protein
VFDPTYLFAEGFEKEHKKGVMPDKYKELMSDQEIDELVAYLSTLKDGSVQTPKPIKK